MAADRPSGAGDEQRRPNGMPTGRPWGPGQSGNPVGVSKYQAEVRRAIEGRFPVSEVIDVLAAMKEDACAHEKFSAGAAKVFLAYTAGETKHLPDERLEKMVEARLQAMLDEAEARQKLS